MYQAAVRSWVSATQVLLKTKSRNAGASGKNFRIMRSYQKLYLWEAGQEQNLVAGQRITQAVCYGDGTVDTCDYVSIGGGTNNWVTDATYFIWIYVPAAERNQGVWDTTKYALRASSGNWALIFTPETLVSTTVLNGPQ